METQIPHLDPRVARVKSRRSRGFSFLTLSMAVIISLLTGYAIGREHMRHQVLSSIRQIVHEAAPHLSQEELDKFTIVSADRLGDHEDVMIIKPVE